MHLQMIKTGTLFLLLCFETVSHYVAQATLELRLVSQLMIVMPQPPECQDYRSASLSGKNGKFYVYLVQF
jgi:hypothetical protein